MAETQPVAGGTGAVGIWGTGSDVLALEVLPVAAVVIDEDGRATAVNRAWGEASGLDATSSLGHGYLAVLDPQDREELTERLRQAVRTGERGRMECRLSGEASGGRMRWWWEHLGQGRLLACAVEEDDERDRERRLEAMRFDSVTGLVDRSDFLGLVGRAMRHRGPEAAALAVILVDFDGRTPTEPEAGGRLESRLLVSVAQRVLGAVRSTDVVARVRRDGFAILLDDIGGRAGAASAVRALTAALEDEIELDGVCYYVRTTIGFAMLSPATGESPATLLSSAEAAMDAVRDSVGTRNVVRVEPDRSDLASFALDLGHQLFGVGLVVQSATRLGDAAQSARLEPVLDQLDRLIDECRKAGLAASPACRVMLERW